jgi:hypothetical protein
MSKSKRRGDFTNIGQQYSASVVVPLSKEKWFSVAIAFACTPTVYLNAGLRRFARWCMAVIWLT